MNEMDKIKEIPLSAISEISEYWIVYRKESGAPGHIQLSACANNFALHRGGCDGERQPIGLRYEKDGFGCYELFTAGHLLVKCPLKPNFLQSLLKGKKAEAFLREEFLSLEHLLNGYGWMTVEENP